MEPRGKTKQLVDAMRAQPGKLLWTTEEAAAAMDVEGKGSLSARLQPALERRWLYRHDLGGRKVAYSLQPPATPEDEPQPFSASLWTDGELVLRGVVVNEDGSVTLPSKATLQVKALLHGDLGQLVGDQG